MSHARLTSERNFNAQLKLKNAMLRHVYTVLSKEAPYIHYELRTLKIDEKIDNPRQVEEDLLSVEAKLKNVLRDPNSNATKLLERYNLIFEQWMRIQNDSEDYEVLLMERFEYIDSLVNLQKAINAKKYVTMPLGDEEKRTGPSLETKSETSPLLDTMQTVHDSLTNDLGISHFLPVRDSEYKKNQPGMCSLTGIANFTNAAAECILDPQDLSKENLTAAANNVIQTQNDLMSSTKKAHYLTKALGALCIVTSVVLLVAACAAGGGLAGLGLALLSGVVFTLGIFLSSKAQDPLNLDKNLQAKSVARKCAFFSSTSTSKSTSSVSSTSSSSSSSRSLSGIEPGFIR